MKYLNLAAAAILLLPVQDAFAAQTLRWPVPWKAGLTLEYASEDLETRTKEGQQVQSRVTSDGIVRITSANDTGYVQEWVSNNIQHQLLKGEDDRAALIAPLLASFNGVAVQVELDRDGNYSRVQNIDEIGTRMRTAMAPAMRADAERRAAALEPAQREKARAQIQQGMDTVLAQITAPAVLEAMLSKELQLFNAFVGIEYEAGAWYEVATELDNPLGGTKFPSRLEFTMYASEDDPEDILVEWNSSIDPEKGLAAVWEIVEKMTGRKATAAERKQRPKELDLKDEGFFVFHRDTGVPEMMEFTRSVTIGGETKVERQRMRLTNGDHEHFWKDEAAEAEDDAPAQETAGE